MGWTSFYIEGRMDAIKATQSSRTKWQVLSEKMSYTHVSKSKLYDSRYEERVSNTQKLIKGEYIDVRKFPLCKA